MQDHPVVRLLNANFTEPNGKHALAVEDAAEKMETLAEQVQKAGQLATQAGEVVVVAQVTYM